MVPTECDSDMYFVLFLTLPYLNEHVVNRLLRENRKTIPNCLADHGQTI